MTNRYPRESIEFQAVIIRVDGIKVTTGIEYCVVTAGERPEIWVAPVVVGTQSGFMVDGYDVGTWDVWAKVTSAPEIPVLNCGSFIVN